MTIANYSICQIEYEINEDDVSLGTGFLIKLSIYHQKKFRCLDY